MLDFLFFFDHVWGLNKVKLNDCFQSILIYQILRRLISELLEPSTIVIYYIFKRTSSHP